RISPALGLRAGSDDVFIVTQANLEKETRTMAFTHWLSNHLGLSPRPASRRNTAAARRRPRTTLALETLEDRLGPPVLTVNGFLDNTTADILLSLREAVQLVDNGGNTKVALGRNLTAGEQAQVDTTQPFGTNDAIVFAPSQNNPQTIT